MSGLPVVFLPRHDKGHRLSPSDINYRANIDVLKRAGVTDLISLSACGSFKEELPPGTFVLVDQFVDRTHKRESSFFGRGCVAHVSMAHPVSPRLRIHLAAAAEAEGIKAVRGGTSVCIEGPQFSTLAESLTYQGCGILGDRHDQHAGSQTRPRGRDFLRHRRNGDRLRLLASGPRCGDGAGTSSRCSPTTPKSQRLVARVAQDFPARARAVSDRLGPRARQRVPHRAGIPRPCAVEEARCRGGTNFHRDCRPLRMGYGGGSGRTSPDGHEMPIQERYSCRLPPRPQAPAYLLCWPFRQRRALFAVSRSSPRWCCHNSAAHRRCGRWRWYFSGDAAGWLCLRPSADALPARPAFGRRASW